MYSARTLAREQYFSSNDFFLVNMYNGFSFESFDKFSMFIIDDDTCYLHNTC